MTALAVSVVGLAGLGYLVRLFQLAAERDRVERAAFAAAPPPPLPLETPAPCGEDPEPPVDLSSWNPSRHTPDPRRMSRATSRAIAEEVARGTIA